jgi:hypothetical protein
MRETHNSEAPYFIHTHIHTGVRPREQTYPIHFWGGAILGYIDSNGSLIEELETIWKDVVTVQSTNYPGIRLERIK